MRVYSLHSLCRHGNKFYENQDETLWRHRWVDFASVRGHAELQFTLRVLKLTARDFLFHAARLQRIASYARVALVAVPHQAPASER